MINSDCVQQSVKYPWKGTGPYMQTGAGMTRKQPRYEAIWEYLEGCEGLCQQNIFYH
jgi:hypothetical protein